MFEALRRMILPIIIVVLFFFVAMIVLQWGLDLTSRDQFQATNAAGIINGEEVPWQDFSQTYTSLLQNERASRGEEYEIPEDRARQLEEEAWNQIVADRLIKQTAEQFNVVISDEDVYQYLKYSPPTFLQQAPQLQTNGQFDYQKYLSLMTDDQAASLWASIDPMVRDELKRIKVQQIVTEAAHVTEAEVRQAFMDNREKIRVGMVNAPFSRFYSKAPEVNDEDLEAYFNEHVEDYPVDARVIVDIVKVDKLPSAFDTAQAIARAQMIYDSVSSGSDFGEFARIYSEDVGSAAASGDLGWFPQGRMVREFDSAAFNMREDEISTPIKTAFGWHVLKHHGYRTENDVQEVHVSHILIKATASEQTIDEAWEKLDKVRNLAGDTGFEEIVAEEGLTIVTSDPTARTGYLSVIGTGGEVLGWAFDSDVGTISDVIDLPNNYCVLRVVEKLDAGTADFEDVKLQVQSAYRNERVAVIVHDTLQMIYDDLANNLTLDEAAIKYDLQYEELGPFSRDASQTKLGNDQRVIGTAFGLSEVGQMTEVLDYSTGSVIMVLLERQSPDLTEYNEKRDSVYSTMLGTKQQQAFSTWFGDLREAATIESNVTFRRR